MEISLFGQFEIVIGYTLFKDSRNLLENFWKIFLELRCEVFKKLLNFLFYFFAIDLLKIIFDLRIDAANDFFKVAYSLLQLIELYHNFLEFDIN